MSIKDIFKPIDLTKGSITKDIILFSIPILLTLLLQQVYTITDAAIAGQNLSANEIAGINDVGCLTVIILQFGFGCSSGFSALTSKAFGANRLDDVKKSFSIQIVITFLIGLVLTIVGLLSINIMLSWINITKENPIYEYAYLYIFIYFCGTIAQLFFNLFSSVLRSIGDSITPLIFLLVSCVLNVFLDILFIVTFSWGVAGAAIATIIAQILSGVLCFIYSYKKYDVFKIKLKDLNIDWKYAWDHIKNGVPLGLQFSVLAIGIILMQGAVVKFDIASGDATQPSQLGYGAANKLSNALMTFPSGLGSAMLSFCGQNEGAKEYERVKKGVNTSLVMTIITCIILCGVGLLLTINGAFLYLFLSPSNINTQTIKYAQYYFYINMPLYFFLGMLFVGRNSLQGIEKPLFPFLAGVAELVTRVVVCLYLPMLVNPQNPTSDISYFAVMCGDGFAWINATIVLMIGLFKNIYCNSKYNFKKLDKKKETSVR